MKNRLRRNIKNVVFVLLFILIFLAIGQLANGKVPEIFGYRIFRVVSQSMMPAISDETCIIIHAVKEEDLKVGDIITFLSEDPRIYGYYNTHRIYAVEEAEDGKRQFVTKGDANLIPDEPRVSYSKIIGRYVAEVPFGVWIAKAMKALSNKKVYFIVIMVPIVICFISYFWQLLGIITGRNREEEDEDDENEGEDQAKDQEKEVKMENK